MEHWEKVVLLHEVGKEVDALKERYPEADDHTLALVRLMLLEKMKEA